jgi:hypothetical protein
MSGITRQQIVFAKKLVLSVNRSAVFGLGSTPSRLMTWTDQLLSTISKRLLPLLADIAAHMSGVGSKPNSNTVGLDKVLLAKADVYTRLNSRAGAR